MTRFARAKGSKASNERVPEEASSWSDMKQQLLNKNKEIEFEKKRKEVSAQRQANYKAFLDEREENENKKIQWADFPDNSNNNKPKKKKNKPKNDSNKKLKLDEIDDDDDDDETFTNLKEQLDKVLDKHKVDDGEDSDAPPEEKSAKKEEIKTTNNKIVKKTKQPKKTLLKIVHQEEDKQTIKTEAENELNLQKLAKKKERRQKQKEKKKKLLENSAPTKIPRKRKEDLTEEDMKKIQKKKEKKLKQLEKRKKLKAEKQPTNMEKQPAEEQPKNNSNRPKNINMPPQKPGKPRDTEQHSRRKPKQHTMRINGKEVEIAYVDTFPIKKEDADRLQQLRREMISKGLPRSEINIAMKLERRKAEKAFAREKKKVCFNCRKSGHNLSECPELEKDQVVESGTGICYKCGSTEHTHFECKVVRGQEFRFAQCFICNEQGHIAKQCPDNARGLYPKGGACKVCGDVTHLKKDCPKYQAQQEDGDMHIETVNGANPDDLDGGTQKWIGNFGLRKLNKIIKF